jgi:hypothetical protein
MTIGAWWSACGGGQEINAGEAGLTEWFSALQM